MTEFFPFLSPVAFLAALGVALIAGTVKGLVGFAMPTILISGLGTFLSPEIALAGLILPTVVTNGVQAMRQGWRAARDSIVRFHLFIGVGLICLFASAQTFRFFSTEVLFLLIGAPVTVFAVLQLAGWRLNVREQTRKVDIILGGMTGAIGGVSGIWGPPTVAYLTALNTEKREHLRIQGVVYGLGAVALVPAHMGSGILTAGTAGFSALLLIPALAGMWAGSKISDRIDQAGFRRATLIVLLLAGLNLIRRGLWA